MKFISQRLKYVIATPLFLVASLVLSFTQVEFASAATLTWTGDGDGTTFADGDNWSTDSAPVDGDVLAFTPLAGGTEYQAIYLTNDLVGVELAGVVSTKTSSDNTKSFYIDTIAFQDDATITVAGSGDKLGYVNFRKSTDTGYSTATVSGLGDIVVGVDSGLDGVLDIAGNLTANGYVVASSGSVIDGTVSLSASGTLIDTTVGGTLTLPEDNKGMYIKGSTATIANNFVINEQINTYANQMGFGKCATEAGGGAGSTPFPVQVLCASYATATYTLSGDITLNADLIIAVASKSTVKLTGDITYNGHTITQYQNSTGTLQIASETVDIPEITTDLDGESPSTSVTVSNKETAILNGTRAFINVSSGGVLKGTGTASGIFVNVGGTLNPGNSPGVINTGTLSINGTYLAEILNEDSYDQTVATTSVSINDGTLDTVLYDGWSIEEGDAFMIIDNQSEDAVAGTFSGLDEGTQFTVEDGDVTITFSITYEGGDGNDVVLTALNAGSDPTPPNTGVAKLILANPAIVAILGLITAGLLALVIFRRRAAN
jgi:fibronectin-binding autotransporter adhesin